MRKLILITCLALTACGPNYYLRRAKLNTLKAVAMGAKIDTVKTVKHDTIQTEKLVEKLVDKAKIDTVYLSSECPKAKNNRGVQKAIQKAVCPDVVKDTVYNIVVDVAGKKYKLPVHIKASSIAGDASLEIDAEELKIPYTVSTSTTNDLQPSGQGLKWYHLLLAAVSGVVVGYLLRGLGKV